MTILDREGVSYTNLGAAKLRERSAIEMPLHRSLLFSVYGTEAYLDSKSANSVSVAPISFSLVVQLYIFVGRCRVVSITCRYR